jgi:hypothetical protein
MTALFQQGRVGNLGTFPASPKAHLSGLDESAWREFKVASVL